MPRGPSGIYTLPGGYLATDGDTILASQHNPPLEDIAQALTDSLPRSGVAPMTGNLAMGANKITNLAAGTGAGDAVRFDQLPATSEIGEALIAAESASDARAILDLSDPAVLALAVPVTDVHSITASGAYSAASSAANRPPVSGDYAITAAMYAADRGVVIATIVSATPRQWIKTRTSGGWQAWREVVTESSTRTQEQWNAGTDETRAVISPAELAQAIAANGPQGWELVVSQTIDSTVSAVTITDLGGYRDLMVRVERLTATASGLRRLRVGNSGGILAGIYQEVTGEPRTHIELHSSTAAVGRSGGATIYNFGIDAYDRKPVENGFRANDNAVTALIHGGALDRVEISTSVGDLTGGRIDIWGRV